MAVRYLVIIIFPVLLSFVSMFHEYHLYLPISVSVCHVLYLAHSLASFSMKGFVIFINYYYSQILF